MARNDRNVEIWFSRTSMSCSRLECCFVSPCVFLPPWYVSPTSPAVGPLFSHCYFDLVSTGRQQPHEL